MFRTILGSAQVNSGENTEIKKQSHENILAWWNKTWSCLIFINLYFDGKWKQCLSNLELEIPYLGFNMYFLL